MYELNKMVFCKIYQPLKFEQKSFRKEYDMRPQSSRLERKKKKNKNNFNQHKNSKVFRWNGRP